MNSTLVRFIAAAAIVWVVLSDDGGIVPSVVPYSGRLTEVHTAAKAMQAPDREALAKTMQAGAKMIAADSLGKISTTEKWQSFTKTLLEFAYQGVGSPARKYPAVAGAIQKELERVTGDKIEKVDAAKRSQFEASLRDIGEALK